MAIRTYEKNATKIEIANDLDEIVVDKRENWRANAAKASQRQRRYKSDLLNNF